jgi:hypothetical protein
MRLLQRNQNAIEMSMGAESPAFIISFGFTKDAVRQSRRPHTYGAGAPLVREASGLTQALVDRCLRSASIQWPPTTSS